MNLNDVHIVFIGVLKVLNSSGIVLVPVRRSRSRSRDEAPEKHVGHRERSVLIYIFLPISISVIFYF